LRWRAGRPAFSTGVPTIFVDLISPGNDHDLAHAEPLLEGIEQGALIIADKGYDADGVRACIRDHGAVPNIPNRSNRKTKFRWKKAIYRQRNRVERFFNKLNYSGV
jgi:transposase